MNKNILEIKDHNSALSEIVDARRLAINVQLNPGKKSALGQFMTPRPVAQFMASLFNGQMEGNLRLLDAGAGVGSLTAAFVEEFLHRENNVERIEVTAYESDPIMVEGLQATFENCQTVCEQAGIDIDTELRQMDFIEAGTDLLRGEIGPLFDAIVAQERFTHAILNPPYKKIHSDSAHRQHLSSIGIETSNLYAGFLAIAIKLLEKDGELVAITPRSFCNGPYFKPFRQLLLDEMNIKRIHIFESRTQTFKDEEILQENIILHAVKERRQGPVTISVSEGADFSRLKSRIAEFSQVVHANDPQQFIHVTTNEAAQRLIERMYTLPYTLQELGIGVSTGPIVDFRLKEYLRQEPESDTLPLIYPTHIQNHIVVWPVEGGKKPNAIMDVKPVQKWLYPNGYYTIVRRFSSKEERRRVVAAVYIPDTVPGEKVGFENHLNVFHRNRQGLTPALARGLAVYLNSTFYDICFRQFNGHTQVNAKDLYNLRYPDLAMLEEFGNRVANHSFPTQEEIDRWIEEELF